MSCANQFGSPDKGHRLRSEMSIHAAGPGIVKGHAVDRAQEIDAVRRHAKLNDAARRQV
jgi:hypothetical protein